MSDMAADVLVLTHSGLGQQPPRRKRMQLMSPGICGGSVCSTVGTSS